MDLSPPLPAPLEQEEVLNVADHHKLGGAVYQSPAPLPPTVCCSTATRMQSCCAIPNFRLHCCSGRVAAIAHGRYPRGVLPPSHTQRHLRSPFPRPRTYTRYNHRCEYSPRPLSTLTCPCLPSQPPARRQRHLRPSRCDCRPPLPPLCTTAMANDRLPVTSPLPLPGPRRLRPLRSTFMATLPPRPAPLTTISAPRPTDLSPMLAVHTSSLSHLAVPNPL